MCRKHCHRPQISTYGVGAVLYEMLTGRWPFEEELLNNLDRKLLENRYPQIRGHRPPRPSQFNTQLAPGLEAVVTKCLAHPPRQRFQSAPELAKALAGLLEGKDRLWPEPLDLKQMMV